MTRRLLLPSWLLVLCVLLAAGCTLGNPQGSSSSSSKVGWQGAGLEPSADGAQDSGTGFQRLVAMGRHLFAMDAYTVRGLRQYRVFHHEVGGATGWDTLAFPGGASVYTGIAIDSPYIYFGSLRTAHVFRYLPDSQAWLDIPVHLSTAYTNSKGTIPDTVGSPFSVTSLAMHQDSLIIKIASLEESKPSLGLWGDAVGTSWRSFSEINNTGSVDSGDSWYSYMPLSNKTYVTTYGSGLWYLDGDSRTWDSVPKTVYNNSYWGLVAYNYPRAMVAKDGFLYVGYGVGNTGVYRLNSDGSSWTWLTRCADTTKTACPPNPYEVTGMAVYNGHILAAGTYTPAWLNDSTGVWTYLSQETWCDGFSGSCGGTIYDLLTPIINFLKTPR